eukprot:c24271_g5_i1 orf=346-1665(-)
MAEAGGNYFKCALSLLFLCVFTLPEAAVIITKDNTSLVFESADSSFTPKVPSTGICGILFSGIPSSACTPLSNVLAAALKDSTCSQFVLVSRGDCSFDTKVHYAQDAGFQAVLVADNVENPELVTMAGNKRGIVIPAVFISKAAGDVLSKYTNDSFAECWILPSYENIAWLVMVISFISLIAITAVFAICFLIRQQRGRQLRGRELKESNVISYQDVKCMPSTIYKSTGEATGSYDICAICLEDYEDGEMLRILPCNHRFHCSCIDAWLINWRAFCPTCKQDVVKVRSLPTESTPLLSSFNSLQQQVTPALHEVSPVITTQEVCANGINIGPPPSRQQVEPCRFSFNHLPLRSSGTPIQIPHRSRHMSLNSLTDQDSVEAFRASPFFTPPSFFRSSAPNVLASLESQSQDFRYSVINRVSMPDSSFCDAPPSAGASYLQ